MAIAEISAALTALSVLNSAVSTAKESAGHAADFGSIVQKLCKTDEAICEAEAKHSGKLTEKQALDMALAKKRVQTIRQQIKDQLILSGNQDVLREMESILDASKKEHARRMTLIRQKQKERRELMKFVSYYGSIGLAAVMFGFGVLWIFLKLY